MERKIDRLTDHYVVCGLGQTGRAIVRELLEKPSPILVIDRDDDAYSHVAASSNMYFLAGDATEEETLDRCRLEHARGLFAAVPLDTDNLYIVISARDRGPNLRIVARASSESAVRRMKRAGADGVVAPNETGGHRMATLMLNPANGENYYYLAEAWYMKADYSQAVEFNRLETMYLPKGPRWATPLRLQKIKIEQMRD